MAQGVIKLPKDSNIDVDTFCEWFWDDRQRDDGNRTNYLIEALNRSNERKDFIRREKHRVHIYCIALDFDFDGLSCLGKEWRFCKVGITLVDKGADYDRVEIVKKKIENLKDNGGLYKSKTDVVFRLPIRAIDTTNIYDTERRLRKNMGLKVSKELAELLKLPNKTEWALTHKSFIDKVKNEAMKKDKDTSVLGSDGPFGKEKQLIQKDIKTNLPLAIKYCEKTIDLSVKTSDDGQETCELHGVVREE